MATAPLRHITPAEYLARERRAEIKSEYYQGRIYAMSGASREHNLITLNLGGEIRSRLKGSDCETYPGDMRVYIPATGLYTYPDLSIVCGGPIFQDGHFDTLTNPTVLIEILSHSTEAYDRGTKFTHFGSIPGLREYVLVSQDRISVDRFARDVDGVWTFHQLVGRDQSLMLESVGVSVPLDEVYARVNLEGPGPLHG